mmetsp:Transcript_115430/g.327083  ORF Transcript_115430/g.327083 Transcript_115430/m.327083 type:complete len:348 (+) Transcript_115430:72-1115(+)
MAAGEDTPPHMDDRPLEAEMAQEAGGTHLEAAVEAEAPSIACRVLRAVCSGYASLTNSILFLMGMLFVLQGRQLAGLVHSGSLAEAFIPGGAMMPLWPVEDLPDFRMALIIGTLFALTGLLGMLALWFQRAAFVLAYSALAVVFLVWQLELMKTMPLVAETEEFSVDSKTTQENTMLFKDSYDVFTSHYVRWDCRAKHQRSYKVRVNCTDDPIEGQFMQFVLTEFCRTPSRPGDAVGDFDRRVDLCLSQGRGLEIMNRTRDTTPDWIFCRCRSAVFDWLRIVSRWVTAVWLGELASVLTVVYIGAEPNLKRMGTTQHREVLGFAAIGVALLVGRVAIFPGAGSLEPW